ncbi:hypothetical protein D3C72_179450 [compost metagenome]
MTALSLPTMPAMAEPLPVETSVPAPTPVATEAPATSAAPALLEAPAAVDVLATPASESVLAAPASGSAIATPASGSILAAPASPSVIAAPIPSASASTTPVAGPAFSLPSVKLPFALMLSVRPETATLGGTGFAPGLASAPAQYNQPSQQTSAWAGTAEVGLGLLSVGGRLSNYGGFDKSLDPSLFAASANPPNSVQLPYYWPEAAWSTYVRAFGFRFGYLNEQFNRGVGQDGAIGSLVGGLDSGFNILGVLGVDYHALAGWGIHGQTVPGTTTSHIPTEAEASVYVNVGPLNLRAGYVTRATFTGDPSTFLAVITNPMSLASDEQKRQTVNETRLGTYSGPFFGAGFTF